jgi:phosphatidylglycerophosphatase A
MGLPVFPFSMDSLLKYIATLGFIGYLPLAPGTFGTLFAFLTIILLNPSVHLHILILLIILPVGIIASHRAEILTQEKDSRHIIIDEFCGFYFSLLLIPFTASSAITAFFLFRLFDILKPFPIRRLESSLSGGIGIMADDIMAAIYTNIILQILVAVRPGIFSLF